MIAIILLLHNRNNETYSVVDQLDPVTVEDASELKDYTIDELKAMNGDQLEVIYNSGVNRVKEINGQFSTQVVKNKKDAMLALMNVRSLFAIQSFEYTCSETEQEANRTVFYMVQLYKNIQVENGYFQIGTDQDGKTTFIRGEYIIVGEIDVTPDLTSSQGADLIDLQNSDKIQSSQLVIYKKTGTDHELCWKYVIESQDAAQNRIIYLDANNGEEVDVIGTSVS